MNNPQAFPQLHPDKNVRYQETGMTLLRDYFAAAALQGFWANVEWSKIAAAQADGRTDGITVDTINAKRAYLAADAMLA